MIGSENTIYIYVKSENQSQPTDQHFNLPGHTLSNIKAKILEKCKEYNTTDIYICMFQREHRLLLLHRKQSRVSIN